MGSAAELCTQRARIPPEHSVLAVHNLTAPLAVCPRHRLVYWSCAHMVVFSMPFWWLQPITDNLATLFFNSYLSMLSNGDATSSDEADDRREGESRE